MTLGLEIVKWLAFAAMLADHVDLALFDRGAPVLHAIGRFAYPAFAVAFGIGLARSADLLAVAKRLVAPGLVAQLAWAFIPGGPQVNVLLAFGAVAWMLAAVDRSRAELVVRVLAVAVLAAWAEGGPTGLLLIVGAWGFSKYRQPVWAAAMLPFAYFLPSAGVIAGLVAPWAGATIRRPVPRVPGLLARAYAGHLVILAALRSVI